MSEVNVLWSSEWFKLQKNLARGYRLAEFTAAGIIGDPQRQDAARDAGSWLVRARRGRQEVSLDR